MINEEDIIKKPFWVRWLCPHSFTGGVRVICDKKGNKRHGRICRKCGKIKYID